MFWNMAPSLPIFAEKPCKLGMLLRWHGRQICRSTFLSPTQDDTQIAAWALPTLPLLSLLGTFLHSFANITEAWEDPETSYGCSSITPELRTEKPIPYLKWMVKNFRFLDWCSILGSRKQASNIPMRDLSQHHHHKASPGENQNSRGPAANGMGSIGGHQESQ